MSMPQATAHRWMPDEVCALPDDGNRYECIDGVLIMTPAPSVRHQRAVGLLLDALGPYVRQYRLGELLYSSADLEIEPGALVQPDLFVYRIPLDGLLARDWSVIKALRLAVEVLSPSTARYDRGLKRHFYLRSPTDEYWIVDLEARVVERWRAGDERPEVLTETLAWAPDGVAEPLVIALESFFAAVHGETG